MVNGLQAIREGADAVIAVGGDGTLHEVHTFFLSILAYIIKYGSETEIAPLILLYFYFSPLFLHTSFRRAGDKLAYFFGL